MKKTIITVVGKDTIGIIANVCVYLSEHSVNILDISQTIISGYFNMMMIADTTNCSVSAQQMAEDLKKIGEKMGLIIRSQNEEIFNMMHRV